MRPVVLKRIQHAGKRYHGMMGHPELVSGF